MNAPVALKVPLIVAIVDVDGEAAMVLPPAVLARLGVEPGDTIDVVDNGGEVVIRRHRKTPADQITVARAVMIRRRDALSRLAK